MPFLEALDAALVARIAAKNHFPFNVLSLEYGLTTIEDVDGFIEVLVPVSEAQIVLCAQMVNHQVPHDQNVKCSMQNAQV